MIMIEKKAIFIYLFLGFALFTNAQTPRLPGVKLPSFKNDSFNIITNGAKADGISLNTKAIQDAINACNKRGGGVVIIPEGLWLTGPLVLKSNVNLHLKRNALLQF